MGSELKVKTLGEIAENVSRPFDFTSDCVSRSLFAVHSQSWRQVS